MTRRHKQAAALAEKMKAEDEAERQRLLIQRDSASAKRDALATARDVLIDRIMSAANESVAQIRSHYAELMADEDREIAEVGKLIRDLDGEDEPGIGHNSERAAA